MAYTTIDDPSKYFDVTLWTGDGGARTITGLNHKPDLIWTKTRSVGYNHMWSDSSRGFNANSELGSNSTAAEGGLSAETYGYKSGHTSDGWTMVDGTDTDDSQEDGNTNQPSVTYVGWTWAANGGTTASNSNGTITSTVQANTDAGFSIISYTGNGSDGATIGHGLSQTPQIFFPKCLSTSTNWEMYYFPTGGTRQYGYLNLTNAFNTWPHNAPSSTIISLSGSGDSNGNGRSNIGYAFHSVQGYSKIGTYTGNGNADGPFVYTGFKPAWLMVKNTADSSRHWQLMDNKRSTTNEIDAYIQANASGAEATGSSQHKFDFLSNGFKLRGTADNVNDSGDTHLFMAFAEHPFVSSEGVPVTAR